MEKVWEIPAFPLNLFSSNEFFNIEQKVGKIRKVLHFENEIEHKILVTYVIAKVSPCV
ncbi:hypothetical protein [Neisseria meningitidis]|uniref:hypothetical protein n=1 Tax=Neisseria meningitidis TaxID=487 RepID=UPI001F5D412D|nr:hypothetical protein [Neisseria meningitidis]